MQNPFIVPTFIEEMWKTKMICVMKVELKRRLYWRMYGLPTDQKSESSHFYITHVDKFLFVSRVISKEGQIIQGF